MNLGSRDGLLLQRFRSLGPSGIKYLLCWRGTIRVAADTLPGFINRIRRLIVASIRTEAERYADNWKVWRLQFPIRWKYLKDNPGKLWAWVGLFIYHPLDVGLNTSTGGDPRESISVRVFRHRNVNHVYGLISRLANFLFHDDGPKGLGTNGELELSWPAQVFLTFLHLVIVGALLYAAPASGQTITTTRPADITYGCESDAGTVISDSRTREYLAQLDCTNAALADPGASYWVTLNGVRILKVFASGQCAAPAEPCVSVWPVREGEDTPGTLGALAPDWLPRPFEKGILAYGQMQGTMPTWADLDDPATVMEVDGNTFLCLSDADTDAKWAHVVKAPLPESMGDFLAQIGQPYTKFGISLAEFQTCWPGVCPDFAPACNATAATFLSLDVGTFPYLTALEDQPSAGEIEVVWDGAPIGPEQGLVSQDISGNTTPGQFTCRLIPDGRVQCRFQSGGQENTFTSPTAAPDGVLHIAWNESGIPTVEVNGVDLSGQGGLTPPLNTDLALVVGGHCIYAYDTACTDVRAPFQGTRIRVAMNGPDG